MVQDRGNLAIDAQQFVDSHLCNPNGILHRKNHIIRDFDKLADKGKVFEVLRHRQGSVSARGMNILVWLIKSTFPPI